VVKEGVGERGEGEGRMVGGCREREEAVGDEGEGRSRTGGERRE